MFEYLLDIEFINECFINLLWNKSNLVKVSGKSRIYILSSESAKVSNLVLEHIHPSMQYKVLGNYPLK